MEKENFNVYKVELMQGFARDSKRKNIENINITEKTEVKPVDVNELANIIQSETHTETENEQNANNVYTAQDAIPTNNQTAGVGRADEMQPIDKSKMIVVSVATDKPNISEDSILEQKIAAFGFDVSGIKDLLNKKVVDLSKDKIFQVFENLRPQFRNYVMQKLNEAGIELNPEFINDVLDRIFSQWEYSNNGIGGENYKVDFKFTKVIDLLQTIKTRINLAISYGIEGKNYTYESDEILKGSFYENYKTLMYNLLYTDDRYLTEEEIELKTSILQVENLDSGIDILSEQGIKQLDKFSDLLKKFIKLKFAYSEEYASALLDFVKSETTDAARKYLENHKNESIKIQEFIDTFITNSFKSLDTSELKFDNFNYLEDSIDSYSFYSDIYSKSSLQLKFIKNSFNEIFRLKNLNNDEKLAFVNLVFKNISLNLGIEVKRDLYGDIILSQNDLKKLNSQFGNYDFTWFDEMYQIILDTAETISSDVDREAVTIDTNVLFADYETLGAEYINEHLDEMILSNDGGVRKFAQIIQDAIIKFDCTYTERNQLIEIIIKFLCNKVDKNDFNSNELSIDTINKLNEKNIFLEIKRIINSHDLYVAYMALGNGNIEPSSQGSIGDCWLLSAINALASTESGQNLFSNQMYWADDYSGVTIYFAGIDQYVTLSAEEIVEAIEEQNLSNGDNDVLIIELAMQKIIGDINGNLSRTFWSMFIANATIKTNYRINGNYNAIMNWLNELLNAKLAGNNYAACFALNPDDNSESSCLCIDGTTFNYAKGPHSFAITNITSTTVTFTNPWDSSIEYTVLWSEFMKLDIYGIETVYY